MSIATELAKRIVALRYQQLPPEAVLWAKNSTIDLIGCALAGAGEPAPRIVEKLLTGGGASGPSLIWGSSRRVGVLEAAEINGTMGHALDYDDISFSSAAHPTVAIFPGVLALGEMTGASGGDVLTAYIAGFEVQGRVGRAVNVHHYEKGWHPTSTIGIFGAAAGAAHVLKLDVDQTATALAIAVSMATGVKANFGSMTKPLHAGQCTRHGAYAALLAREGFTANLEAFEHKQGYLEIYNGAGTYDTGKFLKDWADPLDILSPGPGLKQYPSCAGTHSVIDAMLMLRSRHGLTPANVAAVDSATHRRVLLHTDRPQPKSVLDAKFSVQYCIARALMHGDVTSGHFEGAAFHDPEALAVVAKIHVHPHAHEPRGLDENFQCTLKVTTTDGMTYSIDVNQPLRGPTNLTPPDRLASKFTDCAAGVMRAGAIPGLFAALQSFEQISDVRELTNLMAASVRATA
jgi:2-methylcitrate dehydratase PrpD